MTFILKCTYSPAVTEEIEQGLDSYEYPLGMITYSHCLPGFRKTMLSDDL